MLPRILAPLFLLLIQDAQPPQTHDDTWKGGAPVPPGAVAIAAGIPVPSDLFVDEMTVRNVRADSAIGRETLNNLIDETLVASEANKRRAVVSDVELDRQINQLDCQLRQYKTSLEAEMKSKGVSMEMFRAKFRKQLLLQQLTREDQRIPANQQVGNDQQKVWLKNKRDSAKIELDRAKLKRGEVALVDGVPIEDKAFVRALLASADKREVRRTVDFLSQYVFGMNLLEQAGIPLTEADVEQEFQERKRTFETNPEYRGIEYEAIVKERTGYDQVALKQTRPFRLNAAVSKLARKLFSETDVKGYYDTNLGWFGPRYVARHVLIRGSDRKPLKEQSGQLPVQSMAQARAQIEGIKRELDKGKRFEDVVAMYSEHGITKFRGGLLDPFTPKAGPPGFPELGEAVTKLEIGRVSDPIQSSAGYHLLKVERVDPPPPVTDLESEIRARLGARYFNDAYDKAPKGWDIRLD